MNIQVGQVSDIRWAWKLKESSNTFFLPFYSIKKIITLVLSHRLLIACASTGPAISLFFVPRRLSAFPAQLGFIDMKISTFFFFAWETSNLVGDMGLHVTYTTAAAAAAAIGWFTEAAAPRPGGCQCGLWPCE